MYKTYLGCVHGIDWSVYIVCLKPLVMSKLGMQIQVSFFSLRRRSWKNAKVNSIVEVRCNVSAYDISITQFHRGKYLWYVISLNDFSPKHRERPNLQLIYILQWYGCLKGFKFFFEADMSEYKQNDTPASPFIWAWSGNISSFALQEIYRPRF